MKTICRPSLVRGSKKKRTKRYNSDASISGPRDLYMLVLILFFLSPRYCRYRWKFEIRQKADRIQLSFSFLHSVLVFSFFKSLKDSSHPSVIKFVNEKKKNIRKDDFAEHITSHHFSFVFCIYRKFSLYNSWDLLTYYCYCCYCYLFYFLLKIITWKWNKI